jgi:hypothetical protein
MLPEWFIFLKMIVGTIAGLVIVFYILEKWRKK